MMPWDSPFGSPAIGGHYSVKSSEWCNYVGVTACAGSSECTIYGLNSEEFSALSTPFQLTIAGSNGIRVRAPPFQVMNALSELGYQVIFCTGTPETLWTLKRERDPKHQ